MAERTWKIRTWDCEKQALGPEQELTLAQYRTQVDAANERARAIHRANVAQLAGRSA